MELRAEPEETYLTGKLPSGKAFEIVRSRKSAVTMGLHACLNVLDLEGPLELLDEVSVHVLGHASLSYAEKGEAFAEMMEWLDRECPEGMWVIALNGKGLAKDDTFHIHGVIVGEGDMVLRAVFNPGKFRSVLRDLENLVKLARGEFEKNLKSNPERRE